MTHPSTTDEPDIWEALKVIERKSGNQPWVQPLCNQIDRYYEDWKETWTLELRQDFVAAVPDVVPNFIGTVSPLTICRHKLGKVPITKSKATATKAKAPMTGKGASWPQFPNAILLAFVFGEQRVRLSALWNLWNSRWGDYAPVLPTKVQGLWDMCSKRNTEYKESRKTRSGSLREVASPLQRTSYQGVNPVEGGFSSSEASEGVPSPPTTDRMHPNAEDDDGSTVADPNDSSIPSDKSANPGRVPPVRAAPRRQTRRAATKWRPRRRTRSGRYTRAASKLAKATESLFPSVEGVSSENTLLSPPSASKPPLECQSLYTAAVFQCEGPDPAPCQQVMSEAISDHQSARKNGDDNLSAQIETERSSNVSHHAEEVSANQGPSQEQAQPESRTAPPSETVQDHERDIYSVTPERHLARRSTHQRSKPCWTEQARFIEQENGRVEDTDQDGGRTATRQSRGERTVPVDSAQHGLEEAPAPDYTRHGTVGVEEAAGAESLEEQMREADQAFQKRVKTLKRSVGEAQKWVRYKERAIKKDRERVNSEKRAIKKAEAKIDAMIKMGQAFNYAV